MHCHFSWFCPLLGGGSKGGDVGTATFEVLFFRATFWGDALVISRQTIRQWHLHVFHSHSCRKPFVRLLFNDHYSDNSFSLHDGACVLQVVQSKSFFDTHPTSHSRHLKLSRSSIPASGVQLSCCWSDRQMFCCHADRQVFCYAASLTVADVLLSCCWSDRQLFCCHVASLTDRCSVVMLPV